MLSPVGSTPQYSEIDFSFVSSRRPSASVCWLIASRHSSSSIIFTALTLLFLHWYPYNETSIAVEKTKNRPLSVIDIGTIINRVTTQIAQMIYSACCVSFIPLIRRDIVRHYRSALPEILQSVIRCLGVYRVSSTPGFLEQGPSCYWALSTYVAYKITDSIVN